MMMWMGGTDDEVIDVDSSECTYLGSSNGSRFVESSLRQLICLLEVPRWQCKKLILYLGGKG